MTYGQQPNGNRPQNNGTPHYYNNANGQNGYYNNQGYQQPQYANGYNPYMQGGAVNTTAQYSYERAQHSAMTRAYGEMTIGLLITAAVAYFSAASGAYVSFLQSTGMIGMFGFAIVQIVLAMVLSSRVMTMKPATARVMFYVFAALMGFTLTSVLYAYDMSQVWLALLICAGFFFVLTMFGLTTKFDMLKFGGILMVGLIVFIVAELLIFWLAPGDTSLMLLSGIGIILFAGMTIYDTQFARQMFQQYQSAGPDVIKNLSILVALNLYLDFINLFLFILRLVGNRD